MSRLLAAILLAGALGMPGWHAHDHPAPRVIADCDSTGVHLANHPDAPDLSAHESCPACVLRTQSLCGTESAPSLDEHPVESAADHVAQAPRPAPPSRMLGRAPPPAHA